MRLSHLVFLLAALLLPLSATALDLYQGEAQVNGPDEASRASGVAKALQQVLVKVSGDRRAADNATVSAALDQASKLMQRFEYRQELVRNAEGRPQANLYLIASFYPASVDDLLARSGLNVWGRERPRVLVLLEEDERLLDRDEAAALVERASSRGLSLRFSSDADAQVVRGLAARGAGSLSTHFGGGYVLYGALGQDRFTLDSGQSLQPIRIAEGSRDAQLADLADALQQVLVSTQLSGGNDPEQLDVWVEGLSSAGDYARVLAYLGKLTPVRELQVTEAEADRLRLAMTVLGGASRLQQTVQVGRLLEVRAGSPTVLGLRAH